LKIEWFAFFEAWEKQEKNLTPTHSRGDLTKKPQPGPLQRRFNEKTSAQPSPGERELLI
jgi:hypothetical protein